MSDWFWGLLVIGLLGWALVVMVRDQLPTKKAPRVPVPDVQVGSKPQGASESRSPVDQFINEIEATRREIDAEVASAKRQETKDFEDRHAEDLKVKERLSLAAKNARLDSALLELWEEIKYYPTWSQRSDFVEYNMVRATEISGSTDDKIQTISFTSEGTRFKVTRRDWSGFSYDDSSADLALFENDEEMFSVTCNVTHDEVGVWLSAGTVRAMKQRGNWATTLLKIAGWIEIGRHKTSIRMNERQAEEARTRFAER